MTVILTDLYNEETYILISGSRSLCYFVSLDTPHFALTWFHVTKLTSSVTRVELTWLTHSLSSFPYLPTYLLPHTHTLRQGYPPRWHFKWRRGRNKRWNLQKSRSIYFHGEESEAFISSIFRICDQNWGFRVTFKCRLSLEKTNSFTLIYWRVH